MQAAYYPPYVTRPGSTDVLVLWLSKAYDEATREVAELNSKLRSGAQRLVLDSAPRPPTETVTTQPFNRDRLVFEEQSPDGWLY